MMMLCSYRSSCLESPVALVDFQVEGCLLHLQHVCKGGYVILNDIYFDRAEQNICRDYFDDIGVRGKSEKLKKVGEINLYGTYKSEEDE